MLIDEINDGNKWVLYENRTFTCGSSWMKIDSVMTVHAVAIRNYVRAIQLLSEVITSTSIRMRTGSRGGNF
jgi:hypothetical protein